MQKHTKILVSTIVVLILGSVSLLSQEKVNKTIDFNSSTAIKLSNFFEQKTQLKLRTALKNNRDSLLYINDTLAFRIRSLRCGSISELQLGVFYDGGYGGNLLIAYFSSSGIEGLFVKKKILDKPYKFLNEKYSWCIEWGYSHKTPHKAEEKLDQLIKNLSSE